MSSKREEIAQRRAELARRQAQLSEEQRGRLAQREQGQAGAGQVQPIPRRASAEPAPLSYAQQRLWLVEQLHPGYAAYISPVALRFEGSLDVAALEQALNAIVARHEVLRATITAADGLPVQVAAPVLTLPLPVTDMQEPPASEGEAASEGGAVSEHGAARVQDKRIFDILQDEMNRRFDLQHGPLLRARLLRLGPQTHVLLLIVHHIVFDDWSLSVLLRELAALYTAISESRAVELPPLPVQYADFAVWQRAWLRDQVLETQRAYWKQQLAGAPELLTLPTDAPRPPEQTFIGALRRLTLPVDLSETLTNLGRQEGATLFMVLFAAFNVLLQHYTRQTDIVVGSPIANRTRSEIEPLIGFFVNMLPLRTDLTGDPSFRDLLKRVRETTLSAYTYQDLPFDKLVEALQISREPDHTPIFQVVFALQNALTLPSMMGELSMRLLPTQSQDAQFDLSVLVEPAGGKLCCIANYNTDLFTPETVDRLLKHYHLVLQQVMADPGRRVSELFQPDAEDRRLLAEWNPAPQDYARRPFIHERVTAQAIRTPEALAAVFSPQPGLAPSCELSYAELERRAGQLARLLHTHGVGPESVVAVYADPAPEVIVALLGVLKAGAAYLPVATDTPPARLGFMLKDAQARVLLTQQRHRAKLTDVEAPILCLDTPETPSLGGAPEPLAVTLHPANAAYVIYTSGSTGDPKGVIISHESLSNLVEWHVHTFKVSASDRATQVAGFGFDACVWELWPYLAMGACVYFPAPEWRMSAEKLQEWLIENAITISFLPTPLAESILALPWPASASLRTLLTGGDKLRLYPPDALPFALVNNYGPTEDTVVATTATVPPVSSVSGSLPSVGRPIRNTQAYVLNEHLQPAPVGIPGQLCLGGAGLARGYLQRPALTAEKFVPHPFSSTPGQRLYLTGDLARYRTDGSIEFMGRMDYQVKIRGFRIELGEIENLLMRAPGVQEAALLVLDGKRAGKQLVAFVTSQRESSLSPQALRDFLSPLLPHYMIPATFVILGALPMTPNGKINRHALERLALTEQEMQGDFVAARTPLEEQLCELWQQLLGVDRVGIHDNFFELGGHSLLAIQLLNRLSSFLKRSIPLPVIFEAPTIALLAEKIVVGAFEDGARALVTPISHAGPLPLSFMQEQLWLIDQMSPGNVAYHLGIFLRLTGLLDRHAWEQGLNLVIERHAVLRTTFECLDGNPVQVIAPSLKIVISTIDAANADFEEIARQASIWARRPFSLATGPLIRGAFYRVTPSEHYFLLAVHHSVIDGWSLEILLDELACAYTALLANTQPALPEMSLQYADFSVWQREWQRFGLLNRQLEYWTRQLANAPQVLTLPLDHPRPPIQTYNGASEIFVFPADLATALRALSRRENVSLFTLLLAAFQSLLYRYTQQPDIVVGVPVANRQRPEIENLIGYFVNTLAIRVRVEPDGAFLNALAQTRNAVMGAFACQEVPLQHIVGALHLKLQPSYNPLFQVMFNFLQIEEALPQVPGLEMAWKSLDIGASQFDLSLVVEEGKDNLRGIVEYNTDLFERSTAQKFQAHYLTLLRAIVDAPQQTLAALWNVAQIPSPQAAVPAPEAAPQEHSPAANLRQRRDDLASRRAGLSDEKRALLEKRLRGE